MCRRGWHHFRWSLFEENDIAFFTTCDGQPAKPVCLRAAVTGGPRRLPAPQYDPMQIIPRIDRTRLELQITDMRDGSQAGVNTWHPAAGRATLFVDGHVTGIHAGDRIEVLASMWHCSPPRNPGEFDYSAHLRADGKLVTLRAERPECVKLLEPSASCEQTQGSAGAWQLLDHVRAAGHRVLWQYLDERSRGLAAALLLGSRDQLDRKEYDHFAQTGTIHLLVVSGLHVGILAVTVLLAVRLLRMPRRRGLLAVAVATIAYTLVTDSHPPAVRATVLVLVMCLAYALAPPPLGIQFSCRRGSGSVGIEPGGIVSHWRTTFLFGSGDDYVFRAAHLPNRRIRRPIGSALARSGTAANEGGKWGWRWFYRAALTSLAIWLVAMPLIMARFHIISPGSIVLTPILLPFVAGALGFGLIVLAFGWLLPPLAMFAAVPCNWCLWFTQWLVDAAHACPGSHFWVSGPDDWWLGFYGGLGLMLAFRCLRPSRLCFAALLVGWIAVGLVVSMTGRNDRQLACTFLSVGHGCATVIELPDGRTILYDTGQFSSPSACARTVADCLWSHGIMHLNAVVISHADADHYNGLPQLMEMISVDTVYVSPQMFDAPGNSLRALEDSIRARGIPSAIYKQATGWTSNSDPIVLMKADAMKTSIA